MAQRIEDYALIGNNATAALVGRNGSIDWLAFPRFDSAACFAALLGSRRNGRWIVSPAATNYHVTRRYRAGTLVLETEFSTDEGSVLLIDAMDRHGSSQNVIRIVKGLKGKVPMYMELVLRFDYGVVAPWVHKMPDGRIQAMAGPDRVTLATSVPLHGEQMMTVSEFTIEAGEETSFLLTWSESHTREPKPPEAGATVEHITQSWKKWSGKHCLEGPYADAILRSIIVLKALEDQATSGIIAAATTSLPEEIGGERNWDYRYCWLRDATLTLLALFESGFTEEARGWRNWLMRALAGDPSKLQIMYGVAGERRLTEFEVQHLAGYEGSKPVRIGNAASEQLQLDVYGEVMDALFLARLKGVPESDDSWNVQKLLCEHLEEIWAEPDDGIWEVRGPRRHFVFSKVMAWVAFDRAIQTIEQFGEDGPLERWRKVRAEIKEEICALGYSRQANSFVQYYGSTELDASTLMFSNVGFLPASDERMKNSVAAIEKRLLTNGLVRRYSSNQQVEGLPGKEGAFLACSFWLADNYILQGRLEEGRQLFERLLTLRNDVGLLSEEYDPDEGRQLGNFPQAFSHLALIHTALLLTSKLAGETTGPRNQQQ